MPAELDFGATPAGVSMYGSRQTTASVSYQPWRPARSQRQLSCRVSYYRLDLENAPSHDGWLAQLNLGNLLGWGGAQRPAVTAESRAMALGQTRRDELEQAVVDIHVFEDRNGDGERQADEPGVADARVKLDGGYVLADEDGVARARLREGKYTAELLMQGSTLDYFVPSAAETLTVSRLEHRSLAFALRPACRISGRVALLGVPDATPLSESIRVTIAGLGMDREAVSGRGGAFDFGLVPEGNYRVMLDVATLAEGTVVEGAGSIGSQCQERGNVDVIFTIRNATARERFLSNIGNHNQQGGLP